MGDRQTSEERKSYTSADRELYSGEIAWLLLSSGSALGQRGTLSAVVAAIERGGGGSSTDYEHTTDQQLGAMWGRDPEKGEGPREGAIERTRRLLKRWHRLSLASQRTLIAHYLGTVQASGKVRARFAELSGVVVELWCRAAERKRAKAIGTERVRLTRQIVDARAAGGVSAILAVDALVALRADLEATLIDREGDLRALDGICSQSEPPGWRHQADRAVRAAHRDWRIGGSRLEELELEEVG